MARKKLTAEQCKAIDWTAFFNSLKPAVAAFLQMLLAGLLAKQAKGATCGPDDCCCQVIKDLDTQTAEKLCALVESYLELSDAVQSCPCTK